MDIASIPSNFVHEDNFMLYEKLFKVSKHFEQYFVTLYVVIHIYTKINDSYEKVREEQLWALPIDHVTQDKYIYGHRIFAEESCLFSGIPMEFWTIDDLTMDHIVRAIEQDCEGVEVCY